MLKKEKKDGVDRSSNLFLPELLSQFFAQLKAVPAEGKLDVEVRGLVVLW